MKKVISTLIAAFFAASLGAAYAQETSGVTMSTDPARAEAIEKKAHEIEVNKTARQRQREKILERKSHVAKAHKKADTSKLQQQREDRLERKSHVAKAHKKADASKLHQQREDRLERKSHVAKAHKEAREAREAREAQQKAE